MLDPVQYGMASIALHRTQLDQFLRGAFFGMPTLTTENEVDGFFKNDEMPRRAGDGKKKATVTLRFMAQAVADEIARQSKGAERPNTQKLPNMLEFAKKSLDGAVHGGVIVHAAYYNEMVCFNPSELSNGQLVTNATVISLLAMTQIGGLSGHHGGSKNISFSSHFDGICREFIGSAPNFPKPLP
jgi:hypothetical protein